MQTKCFLIGLFLLQFLKGISAQKGQVFLSENRYFDKETKCAAATLKGDKEIIMECVQDYCKKLSYQRLLTKIVYLSYQGISLRRGKEKNLQLTKEKHNKTVRDSIKTINNITEQIIAPMRSL